MSVVGLSVNIDRMSEDRWTEILAQFDDGSIYQTWAYGSVHWSPDELSHLVVLRDGVVCAAAQIRVVLVPVLNRGVAYVRWGPLWRLRDGPPDANVLDEVLLALKGEYVDRRRLLLRVIPRDFVGDDPSELCDAALGRSGFRGPKAGSAYTTARLDLSPSLPDLRHGMHRRWRGYLNSAERDDLQVVQGDAPDLFDKFCDLYSEMMARKAFKTTVDIEEFRRMQRYLEPGWRPWVLLCTRDGTALNGLVVSAVGDTGIFLLAATSNAGLDSRGAHLLQWRAIERLKEHGCRWYDLGGISHERNPGGYQFKRGIGGQEVAQRGTYTLSGSWLSNLVVWAGEAMAAVRRAKSASKHGR